MIGSGTVNCVERFTAATLSKVKHEPKEERCVFHQVEGRFEHNGDGDERMVVPMLSACCVGGVHGNLKGSIHRLVAIDNSRFIVLEPMTASGE